MAARAARANPFRARNVRPGAIDYLFADAAGDLAPLIDRLRTNETHWQIVGPHGSGKSTLLHQLRSELHRRGHPVPLLTLKAGDRRWQFPPEGRMGRDAEDAPMVFVDGFEQLFAPARWYWSHIAAFRRQRLVVTAHRSMGFPTLYRCQVSSASAERVVRHYLATFAPGAPYPQSLVAELWSQHKGNMREVLFSLYDWFAQNE